MVTKSILGYTAGAFDMFHIGHLNILKKASELCERLIVGVSTDELILQNKGQTPIIPFLERIQIIQSIKYVDMVYTQSVSNKLHAHSDLGFTEIYVGDDWQNTEIWIEYEKRFSERNVRVTYFPYTTHTSSSMIRSLISKKLI
jgi:glycerol-3-phosphate cytidylyltransferase